MYVCVCMWHYYFVIHIKVPHYHLQISWYHGNVVMLQCIDMVMFYKHNNIKPN